MVAASSKGRVKWFEEIDIAANPQHAGGQVEAWPCGCNHPCGESLLQLLADTCSVAGRPGGYVPGRFAAGQSLIMPTAAFTLSATPAMQL